jgi:hypothetical protein
MKNIALVVLLAIVGCGTEEEPEAKEPNVTPALKTYFNDFQGDCQIHKAPCDFDGLVVQLGDFDRAKPEKASCTGKTVTIERALQVNIRLFFYHVMGHCTLGRKDDSVASWTIMGRVGMDGIHPPGPPGGRGEDGPKVWEALVADMMKRSTQTTERDPLDVAYDD